jgi:hypothetical protein
VTETGTKFWFSGAGTPNSAGGIWFNDGTNTTQILGLSNNIRFCQIYSTNNDSNSSQLFCSGAGSGFSSVVQIGSGLPTSAVAATNLSGLPTSTSSPSPSPYSFAFLDVTAGDGVNPDTLYIADDRAPKITMADGGVVETCTNGGIQKWSMSSGMWTCVGTIQTPTGVRGLAADLSGASVTLIATTQSNSPNAIVKCSDNGTTSPSAIACSTLLTAATNKIYRGVALPPLP